jgi:hypothetical protein
MRDVVSNLVWVFRDGHIYHKAREQLARPSTRAGSDLAGYRRSKLQINESRNAVYDNESRSGPND